MSSPFPGMDPYLEGYLWPDVHHALAAKIRQQLTPLLRPHYTARLEIYVVEDRSPENEIGILYPDVEIMQRQRTNRTEVNPHTAPSVTITPATLTLPILQPVSTRIATVEIRDTANNALVSSIEILSPVNKREPNLIRYRQKRQRLYEAGIHLLELDLLRRGNRPFSHPQLPNTAYAIALTRAESNAMEIWAIALQDSLPILPVPLRSPDSDIPLDLPTALREIYEEAAYDLSIDYHTTPPPPPLSTTEQNWMRSLLHSS